MIDAYGRKIDYLRVSVTDKCNLRCVYCMPPEGVPLLRHEEMLSFEQLVEAVGVAVGMGMSKIRITGGEPLVKRGICRLIDMISRIDGVKELVMSTNGTLLGKYADALAEAGVDRINVSLDTMDPERYSQITRGGDLHAVLAGIHAAEKAGLEPIKLNCVVARSSSEPDARKVQRYGDQHGYQVRYIREMDFKNGHFSVVEGGAGGDCSRCNRLRLSSNGLVRPCLFSELTYNVRELGAEQALKQAIENKPLGGGPVSANWIRRVGG